MTLDDTSPVSGIQAYAYLEGDPSKDELVHLHISISLEEMETTKSIFKVEEDPQKGLRDRDTLTFFAQEISGGPVVAEHSILIDLWSTPQGAQFDWNGSLATVNFLADPDGNSGENINENDFTRALWNIVRLPLNERNVRRGLEHPANRQVATNSGSDGGSDLVRLPPPDVTSPPIILSFTGPETHALFSAASDGRSGRHYTNLENQSARVHQVGKNHHVLITLTDEEKEAGYGTGALEAFTGKQDVDAIFTCSYILSCLAPREPVPSNLTPSVWIDLDDVAAKIGLYPDKCTVEERLQTRARIWNHIQFAERAQVIGRRSIPYRDKKTKEIIPTEVHASLWRVMATENDAQPGLLPIPAPDVPRRVQLVLNRDFVPLLTNPNLAQFISGCEKIAAIAGGKPSGAWARVIALTLLREWRMKPGEAVAGRLRLTRRVLLTSYLPKGISVEEVLAGANPRRAREYWRDALQELVGTGVVRREGEAVIGAEERGKDGLPLPRQGWQKEWLDTPVVLVPGVEFADTLKGIADKHYKPKPRQLNAPPRRSRSHRNSQD